MDRHPNRATHRVSRHFVMKFVCPVLSLLFVWALLCDVSFANTRAHHALPMHAIVNGHNLQPRDDQLKALGFSDVTPQQADEVDQLYRQLMRSNLVENQIASRDAPTKEWRNSLR
jgi:hypothetical protein